MNRRIGRRGMMFLTVLALGAATLSAQSGAPADPQVEAAKELYQFDNWVQGPTRAGFDLAAVQLPGYRGGDRRIGPGGMVSRKFEADKLPDLLLEVTVADDAEGAHQRLIEYLAFVASPTAVPKSEDAGFPLGQHGYIGFSGAGPGRISWIAFVEGNVTFRLLCLDPRVDPHPPMTSYATAIAQRAARVTQLRPGSTPQGPTIQRLEARGGSSVSVKLVELDVLTTPAEMSWRLAGDGQGYVELSDDGNPELHITKPGALEVTLVALGRMGTVSTQTLEIDANF